MCESEHVIPTNKLPGSGPHPHVPTTHRRLVHRTFGFMDVDFSLGVLSGHMKCEFQTINFNRHKIFYLDRIHGSKLSLQYSEIYIINYKFLINIKNCKIHYFSIIQCIMNIKFFDNILLHIILNYSKTLTAKYHNIYIYISQNSL